LENAGLSEQPSPKPSAEAQASKQTGEASQPEKKAVQPEPTVGRQSATASNKAKPPVLLTNDIPVAVRETPTVQPRFSKGQLILISGLAGVATIALVSGAWFAMQTQNNDSPPASTAQAQPEPDSTSSPATGQAETVLGHFPYPEAPQAELQAIVPDGSIKLRKAAAAQYLAMVDAARAEGIDLVAISGFRSKNDQDYLFFGIKAERGQVTSQRAQVSAPPGYSEHHTGYAIDIGDGNAPATNLSPTFEKTRAFQWLQANAPHYSFELSFPKNNRQGVSYEPWHWRYVGDRDSLETFYKARSKQ
jgi:zinc D-Ala-D-Ala carboxypeptidase